MIKFCLVTSVSYILTSTSMIKRSALLNISVHTYKSIVRPLCLLLKGSVSIWDNTMKMAYNWTKCRSGTLQFIWFLKCLAYRFLLVLFTVFFFKQKLSFWQLLSYSCHFWITDQTCTQHHLNALFWIVCQLSA